MRNSKPDVLLQTLFSKHSTSTVLEPPFALQNPLGFRRIRRGEMTRSSYWKSSKSHLPTHRRWMPTRDHSCTQLDCRGRYRWGRPQARCNSRLDRCM